MGITQINDIQQMRVFLFIFGGADASMADTELMSRELYLGTVARSIHHSFPKSFLKQFCAMSTFSHIDLQRLVLDTSGETEEEYQSLRKAVRSPARPTTRFDRVLDKM